MLLLLLSVASSSVESVFGLCVNLFKLVRAYSDERWEKEREEAGAGEVLVDIIPKSPYPYVVTLKHCGIRNKFWVNVKFAIYFLPFGIEILGYILELIKHETVLL